MIAALIKSPKTAIGLASVVPVELNGTLVELVVVLAVLVVAPFGSNCPLITNTTVARQRSCSPI